MKIIALIDPETFPEEDPNFEGKSESICKQMEFHIVEALRSLGHQVEILPFLPNIETSVRQLTEAKPDLVFNLTEHVGGLRPHDLEVMSDLRRDCALAAAHRTA